MKLRTRHNGFFRQFDTMLFVLFLLIAAVGLLAVWTTTKSYSNQTQMLIIQGVAFLMGLVAMFFLMSVDYEIWGELSRIIYGISVLLLVATLIFGTGLDEWGGKSWIRIGPVGIQPAEIVKILFIITFAKTLCNLEEDINAPRNIIKMVLHIGVLILLILLQPDAGTAMMFLGIFVGMTFIAGVSWKYFASILGLGVVAAPIAWFFILKDYQKDRIMVFLNPESDPLGSGFQVVQSKIAVGSGQLTGQGVGKGLFTQLGMLPAKHTDFIFSSFSEELGMAGSLLIIGLLFALIIRCLYVGMTARDSFGRYISVGVASMFFVQTLENIGMCIGLLPVTGITLPFMSYGGSSILANCLALGLVFSVSKRRKTLQF